MARPWCFYHVQGEEGESEDEPNAFVLPPSDTTGHVTLRHFLAAFPLANKQDSDDRVYHARFKVKDKICGFAWQDVQDAQAPLPFFQGALHAKILRLDIVPKPISRLRRKPLVNIAGGSGGGEQRRIELKTSAGVRVKPPSSYVPSPAPPTPRHHQNQTSTSRKASRPAPPSSTLLTPQRIASPSNGPAHGSSGNSHMDSRICNGAGEGGVRGSASAFTPPSPPPYPVKPSSSTGGDDLDSFLYGGGNSSGSNGGTIPGPRQQHQPPRPPPTNAASPVRSSPSPPPTTRVSPPPSSARINSSSPAPRPSPPLSAGMAGLDIDDDDDDDDDAPYPFSTTTKTSDGSSGNNKNGSRSTTPIPPNPTANATPEELFFMQPTSVKQAEAAKEEQEQEALRHKLLPRLDAWARDPPQAGGKLRNVRTLLSTMHTVLWPGCVSWKPVFLGDLMAPDRVKFHYRKAMLVVHPDKNVNGSAEQRFVAEKVFTSVNEAYTLFAAQEMK